jgi:hypothetical protein
MSPERRAQLRRVVLRHRNGEPIPAAEVVEPGTDPETLTDEDKERICAEIAEALPNGTTYRSLTLEERAVMPPELREWLDHLTWGLPPRTLQ